MEAQSESSKITPAKGTTDPDKIRRILVCQLRQLGDVLLATPAIELLARRYPQAQIDVYTEKKCIPMLENNPHIHKIIPLDKAALPGFMSQLAFYFRLGRNKYDIMVNFQHLPRCTWVALFSNIKTRIAPAGPRYAKYLYTRTLKNLPGYAAAKKASLLRLLGIDWNGERPRLYLAEGERAAGADILREMGLWDKKFISLDITHFDVARLWPREHYAGLIDLIAEARPDLRFMLSYGPGEDWQVKDLMELCRHKDRLAMFPRALPLRHAAACMERAVMHLGNCSAPRHMAVALDVPTFAILGATSPEWTFPSPEHAYIRMSELDIAPPCTHDSVNSYSAECLRLLTPELVFPAFMSHLQTYEKQ